jgi:protoporphyrinogen oxidase
MKIAILGGGISGLTVAWKLARLGHCCTVFEQNEIPGGLARTAKISGWLYDQYGGHIFNSKYQDVKDWVFSIFPEYKWQRSVRNAKIYFDEYGFISYPLDFAFTEFDTDTTFRLAKGYLFSESPSGAKNLYEFFGKYFGEAMADLYMRPYNAKIWNYNLRDMSFNWMYDDKAPLPNKDEVLRSLCEKVLENKMPHSEFYYPKEGGIQSLVDAIVQSGKFNLLLNTRVFTVSEAKNKRWLVNGQGFDKVINTLPLPELPEIVNHKALRYCDEFAKLKWNSLNTALYSRSTKPEPNWCYIPQYNYASHRVGFQSTLAPEGTVVPDSFAGSGAMEVIGPQCQMKLSMVPEALKDSDSEIISAAHTQYAYVIHDLAYDKNMKVINKRLAKMKNFYSLGRWGQWKYFNMDVCMKEAFKLAEKIQTGG